VAATPVLKNSGQGRRREVPGTCALVRSCCDIHAGAPWSVHCGPPGSGPRFRQACRGSRPASSALSGTPKTGGRVVSPLNDIHRTELWGQMPMASCTLDGTRALRATQQADGFVPAYFQPGTPCGPDYLGGRWLAGLRGMTRRCGLRDP